MPKSWSTFEQRVRWLASNVWGKKCDPEHIGGVDIDGVVEVDADIKVLIEMTEERSLNKVREDVVKLRTARSAIAAQTELVTRCYCVVNGSVTQSMVEAGEPHHIRIMSVENFSRIFFDFQLYRLARESFPFGSSINPLTGTKDDNPYVPVRYLVDGTTKELSVEDIAGLLQQGKKIVLLGEYGSGKSRCSREVFRVLAERAADEQDYPLAIDLRDSWGLKRGPEIIGRHFADVGQDKLQSAARAKPESG